MFLTHSLFQDSFKLLGAKDPRFLFLFQKSLLVTKARPDGTFIYKKEIMVTYFQRRYFLN